MRQIEYIKYAFVHQRWGALGDGRLVAATDGGHSATLLAKELARRASPEECYIVTDTQSGEQIYHTKESVAIADAKDGAK